MPASVKREHRQNMESDAYQIQNWQQISQNVMQSKQEELMTPVYQRLMNAINQVAKENGYAYVYNREALLVAPPADDLSLLVAKKLNIKIPTNNQQQGAATRPTTGTAKPKQ
jgi:outer membrane protein